MDIVGGQGGPGGGLLGTRAAPEPEPVHEAVEEDAVVSIGATQTGATWGLDRIDQRDRPLNQTYAYDATGAGVKAYVIDTGIRTTHAQFGGRAVSVVMS